MGAAEKIGDQVACKNIGASGCYFLCIIHAFGASDGALGWYYSAVDNNIMGTDCYVGEPGKLAALLAGAAVKMHKEAATYQPQPGEVEILRYEVTRTKAGEATTFSHFVIGDGKGGVAWDPWPGSLTVKDGGLVSKRIFTRGA